MNVAVIIVAAGAGTRLGFSTPKAFVPLAGRTLVRHALGRAQACDEVNHVIVVVPPTHVVAAADLLEPAERGRVDIVAGGADRTESVRRGLRALHTDDGIVLVHDAARCLAPATLFAEVIHGLRSGHGAVIPGLAVVDTIKQVDEQGRVIATPPRDTLRAIQTPQGFVREVLAHAHDEAEREGRAATDDAALVEASGARVLVVPGDAWAAKITTADDLAGFERLLAP